MIRIFNLFVNFKEAGSPDLKCNEITCISIDENIYLKYSNVRKFAGYSNFYKYGKFYKSFLVNQLLQRICPGLTRSENKMRVVDISTALEVVNTCSKGKSSLLHAALVQGKPLIHYKSTNKRRQDIFITENVEDEPLKNIFEVLEELPNVDFMKIEDCISAPSNGINNIETIECTPDINEMLEEPTTNEPTPKCVFDSFLPKAVSFHFKNGQMITYSME